MGLEGRRVEVYRHLRKAQWSVRERGKVVAHVDRVVLRDVSFVRARALKTGQRNVHAFARGVVVEEPRETPESEVVTYHPFERGTFTVKDSGKPVLRAELVVMEHPKVYASGITYGE